jgi:hypothetical protein
MFKLCFKNTLTNISILNNISKDEGHRWHAQSHYKQQTFDLFSMEIFKRDIKKKMMSNWVLELKQTCYAL